MTIRGTDAGDDVVVGAGKAGVKADYDTSSGDSCWVRQYLECILQPGTDLAEEQLECVRIKTHQASAA